MQFEPRVCLPAAFAIVPLLVQIFRKGQLPHSPLQEPVKDMELALPPLLIQGPSSPLRASITQAEPQQNVSAKTPTLTEGDNSAMEGYITYSST